MIQINEDQLACVKFFDAKFHNYEGEGIGIHPNRYFSSAMKIMKNINNNSKTNENNKEMEVEGEEKK